MNQNTQHKDVGSFHVEGRTVGASSPPFIIAEMSGNHGGDIEQAFALIRAAKQAGADAVKFQTYEASTITINHASDAFVVQTALWQGRTLYDLYSEAQTPFSWHADLFACAREEGILAFSAPFDHTAVDLLESLSCPLYKVASCEIVDIPLIRRIAQTGKPMIMSTGMASYTEIAEALEAARGAGAEHIAILHCVSGYPTALSDANLSSITKLKEMFDVQVGLSDHSKGTVAATCATAMGATIIEKHLCSARADGAVDSDFSLEPDEFADLVGACKAAHSVLGHPVDGASSAEADSLRFRRSLYVVSDMKSGDIFSKENVRSIRPAGGLHTRYYDDVLGRVTTCDIQAGTALDWQLVDGGGGAK